MKFLPPNLDSGFGIRDSVFGIRDSGFKTCYLQLGLGGTGKVVEIVKSHMIPSMYYKIGIKP